jgi:hypothetical protein
LPKEPGVLDGNNCLVRKGLNQIDLAFAEWLDVKTIKHKDADLDIIAQQRHPQPSMEIAEPLEFRMRVFGVGCRIQYVHDAALQAGAPTQRTAIPHEWGLL